MLRRGAVRTLTTALQRCRPATRLVQSHWRLRNASPNPLTWQHPVLPFPARGMARYEGELPELGPDEFVVLTPEVSGPGGMTVPAELGEVVEILFKPGDTVGEDEIVAVIETCKAAVEARCRSKGVVKEVLVQEGEEVYELQPVLVIEKSA